MPSECSMVRRDAAVEPPERGRRFSESCDLFLIVGTSGVVSGGYGFTQLARMAGAFILEVNPEESALSHLAHATIRQPAAKALPRLLAGISETDADSSPP